ncbi:MAG: glutamate racemase [Candidatus Parcubacteria bacterium]|jgi:glutamate racemase|nr:glutamate racemase [Candidatus Parcubacteria bacterium]
MKKTAGKGSIGVFDSGFGGIAILKEVRKALPNYRYIYLGDTARTPYGTRSMDVVHEFTLEAIDFLFEKGCEIIVVACNTASAEALRRIQREYLPRRHPDRRVLGVIVPVLEEAIDVSRSGRIGVLATEGTVRSGKFPKELRKMRRDMEVFQQSAPLLVPLVEEGEHRSQAARLMLRTYLAPLKRRRIDTLILACTHYGHFEKMIAREMGSRVSIISEGKVIASKLKDYLRRHPEIDAKLAHTQGTTFYTTDLTDKFKTIGARLFGRPIAPRKAVLKHVV